MQRGREDYAQCSGTYTTAVRDGLVMSRILAAYKGRGWCIASLDYLDEFLKTSPPSFGGFHACDGNDPEEDAWENYTVVAGSKHALNPARMLPLG
eukprot:6076991-Amphidinium_carterae.3